jgi:spore germination protein YaaH
LKNRYIVFGIIILFIVLVGAKIVGQRKTVATPSYPALTTPLPGVLSAFPITQAPANLPKPLATQNYSYLILGNANSTASMQKNIGNLNGVIVESLRIEKSDLVVSNPADQKTSFDFIRSQNHLIKRFALLKNYSRGDWQGQETAAMLASSVSRSKVINAIDDYLLKNKLDGVSLDFESLPADSQNNLVKFCGELRDKLSKDNFTVSVHVPAGDPAWQLKNLSKNVDQIILMNYDQHWSTSEAGPIADISWFESSIKTALASVPKEKLIVGMASYAYDWVGNTAESLVYNQAVANAAANYVKIVFDPVAKADHYQYTDASAHKHTVWLADANSVGPEISVAQKYSVTGLALYRFGAEDQNIWKILK